MTVEAMSWYILSQGGSKSTICMDMNKIWAINRKIIDPIVPRFTAIGSKGQVRLELSGGPTAPFYKTLPRHKKNESLGTKITTFSSHLLIEGADAVLLEEGEEVTLMDWGNCIIRKISKNDNGEISEIQADLHLQGDFRKTKRKLTWLANDEHLVSVKLLEYDSLITEPTINDNFDAIVNPTIEVAT